MTRVISGVSMDFNKGWRGAKSVLDQPILFAHMCYTPGKVYTKKINYLSFASPGLRLNGPSAVPTQWRYSNVVLSVILERFHSVPPLSSY